MTKTLRLLVRPNENSGMNREIDGSQKFYHGSVENERHFSILGILLVPYINEREGGEGGIRVKRPT